MNATHTVRIADDNKIEFTCHGDKTAPCHQYPECGCESWELDGTHLHPTVQQDLCWMQDWFDNDGIDPCSDTVEDCEYAPGMSGPIKTTFCYDYVEWEFIVDRPAS